MFMNFVKDESGAVTVDWVVLTAAVVGLGLLVLAAVRPAVSTVAGQIKTTVEKAGTDMVASGALAP